MEVDTGRYFSVISEGAMQRYFRDLEIIKSDINLLTYENNAMEPRGQVKNLKVTLNNKTKNLHCLVLKGNKVPLIRRQWLSEFGLWPLVPFKNLEITEKCNNMHN